MNIKYLYLIFSLMIGLFITISCENNNYKEISSEKKNDNLDDNTYISGDNNNQTKDNSSIELSWKYTPNGLSITSEFVIGNGLMIISCTDKSKGISMIYGIDTFSGDWLWKKSIDTPVISSFCLIEDRLYFGSGHDLFTKQGNGLFYCLNANNGDYIWSTHLLEVSYSSPIYIDGIIYTTNSSWDNKITKLYAINAYNGNIIWESKITGASLYTPVYHNNLIYVTTDKNVYCYDKEGLRVWSYKNRNGDISGSPLINNGRVYIISKNGFITCLDTILGQKIWDKEFISSAKESFEESGFIIKNNLLISTDQRLICLDIDTKKQLWEYSAVNKSTGKNKILAYNNYVFFLYMNNLFLLSLSDGKLLDKQRIEGSSIGNFIIYKSCIYYLSNYLDEDSVYKFYIDDNIIEQNVNVYPFDYPLKTSNTNTDIIESYEYEYNSKNIIETDKTTYNEGDIIWKYDNKSSFISNPVIHNGRLMVISENEFINSVDIINGKELWKRHIKGLFNVPPIVHHNSLFMINNVGQLFELNVLDGYIIKELWVGSSKEVTSVKLHLYKDLIIISNFDKSIKIYKISSNKVIKKTPIKNKIVIEPVIIKNFMYIIDSGGNIIVYDLESHQILIKKFIGGSDNKPLIFNDNIFISTSDKEFLCLNRHTGDIINNYSDGLDIRYSPFIMDEFIYIITENSLHCFDINDIGNPLWSYPIEGQVNNFGKNGKYIWLHVDNDIIIIYGNTGKLLHKLIDNNIINSFSIIDSNDLLLQTKDEIILYNYKSYKWRNKTIFSKILYNPIYHDNRFIMVSDSIKSYYYGN